MPVIIDAGEHGKASQWNGCIQHRRRAADVVGL